MQKEELNKEIRKFALKNALDYGKANTGSVLSKILAIDPALKSDIKKISELVRKTVEEINKMKKSGIETEFSAYSQEFEKREKEKEERTAKPKMELEGAVMGDFATRVPPEPGGYIQIGNAKQAILAAEFAKIYNGKVFLYFDDTNPENCKQEYVDAIKEDYEWLGIRFDREYYASDHIEKIYDLIRKLINKGKAYVCNCDLEKMKKLRFEGEECEHRKNSINQNMLEF
ncbi:MAG: glutamate--tRNA ligase family protein, partial [Candidatus Micrarchaeales archaeon]